MKKLSTILIISLLISSGLGLVAPAHAQQGGLIVIIDDINADSYASDQSIQLYVTVRHPQGGAITDLGPETFTITVGDQTYVPTQAEPKADAHVSIAIVLELYRSMRGEPFEQAKTAIADLCTTKHAQDRVAFFSVHPGIDPDSETIDQDYERDFTYDGGDVNNFVQSSLELINSGTGTPFYDTLARAIRFTSNEAIGQRAIIVITDGGDVGSRYTAETVIDEAEELRVPVFSIGYTGNNRIKDQFLNELARRTGGRYQDTPDAADFGQFIQDVRHDMSQHYLLTYKSEPLSSGRQVLEIRAEAGGLFGVHSKHFDVQSGSATPIPAPPTATPKPAQPTAQPTATTSSTPTAPAATATVEMVESSIESEQDELVDTIQDNLAIIAAIAVGGGLLFILFIAIIIWLRRRRRPQPAWESPRQPYDPAISKSDTIGYGATPTPPRPAPGTETPLGVPQARPSGPVVHPPPAGDFPPAPPAPGRAAPGPVAPSPAAREEKTQILPRGPKMTQHGILIDQQHPENRHDLNKPVVHLGRTSASDVYLDNPKVSRQHATIKLEKGDFVIFDLGSSNGTFVNDKRVTDPVALQDGDVLRFSNMAFVFEIISLDD